MAKSSSKVMQLEFFEPTPEDLMNKRIDEIAESTSKVRKKLFAQN